MTIAPSDTLPKRPPLLLNKGEEISPLFHGLLKRWRKELDEVFSKEANTHTSWPPENPLECFRAYSRRPVIAREMALELAGIVQEIESNDGKYMGKDTYAHQRGQIKWLVFSLLDRGTSYLIEGAPGTGKTLVLGAIMQAATRLQMRNILHGSVVYGTHRPFILSQQTFSPEHRRMRLKEKPILSECRYEWEYAMKRLGPGSEQYFSAEDWFTLRKAQLTDETDAVEKLRALIGNTSQGTSFLEERAAVLPELAAILTGRTVIVNDTDESPLPLTFSSTPESVNPDDLYYSGDLGQGIPREYRQRGLVLARKGADVEGNIIGTGKKDVKKARVLLTTAPSILINNYRQSIAEALHQVEIIIVDDGRNAATAFQEAVTKESKSPHHTPLVFMASALGTTNGNGSRPHADSYSPRLSLEEAIESGVLPNIGVDVFPGNSGTLYPSNSKEALEQLIEAHFAHLPLPEKFSLPQPHLCTTVVLVGDHAIDPTVERLREEYLAHGIPATIVPFRSNKTRRTSRGNTQHPYSERIFQWMTDTQDKRNPKKPVHVLVMAPKNFTDALSLTNLENVTVATSSGIGRNTLLRILGRLEHSMLHRTRGERYRGYFRQGLYKESRPEEMIFSLLGLPEHKDKESAQWVPLRTLRGIEAAAADKKRTSRLPSVPVPLTRKALAQRKAASGQPFHKTDATKWNQNHPVPQERSQSNEVLQDLRWKRLERLSLGIHYHWNEPQVRSAFERRVLRSIQLRLAPPFMRGAWIEWEPLFLRLMHDHAESPEDALAVVKEKFFRSIRFHDEGQPVAIPKGKILRPEAFIVRNPQPEEPQENEESQPSHFSRRTLREARELFTPDQHSAHIGADEAEIGNIYFSDD